MIYTDENISKKIKQKEKIKRIITIIVYIIIIPMLCYNISLIFQSIINTDETPSFFGIKTFVIISGSMEPTLEIGDMIIVKKVDASELEVGDIISFRQGQSIVTHRITEIQETDTGLKFKTKGDNNNAEDSGTIEEDLVEGKVMNVIPLVGKIAVLLQNKIIIITIVLILYLYIVHTGKIKKRREERRRKWILYEYQKQKELNKKQDNN